MVATYTQAVIGQREAAKGLTRTHQGGEAYAIDVQRQLRRFLILGSEGGTFYVSEKALTAQNIEAVHKALALDGIRTVNEIVEVSERGLAPKNEPALLALALAASYTDKNRESYATQVRSYALAALPKVARTGTHLFHFAEYADKLRGWGSALRKGIGRWYTSKSPMALANQVTKYQQRDGWSHADLLRLSHPTPKDAIQDAIFKYIVDNELPAVTTNSTTSPSERAIEYLYAVEQIKHETDIDQIVKYVHAYNLPREVLPTLALNDPKVWEALLYAGQGMPFTAMLRNLATMSKVGLVTQGSDAARFILNRLKDESAIRSARVHPVDVLKAQMVYKTGKGVRSDATWTPVHGIVAALEGTFDVSFGNVQPTNKRLLLALDVSGSMTVFEGYRYGYNPSGQVGLAGVPGLSPRIATGVLAMVTARVEDDYEMLGFSHRLIDLGISKHDSFETVLHKISNISFGGTYCDLPMEYAKANRKKFDAFVVYTDNETGGRNPSQALREYRQSSGIHDAKLIVNAMVANNFSIADPTDPNMLDVVGFDSSAPAVMSAFIRGEV